VGIDGFGDDIWHEVVTKWAQNFYSVFKIYYRGNRDTMIARFWCCGVFGV
jgi:hypothetical protein